MISADASHNMLGSIVLQLIDICAFKKIIVVIIIFLRMCAS